MLTTTTPIPRTITAFAAEPAMEAPPRGATSPPLAAILASGADGITATCTHLGPFNTAYTYVSMPRNV